MSGSPIPDGAYIPTPDEIESARYLVGWADGRQARDILRDYAQRTPDLGDDHPLMHVLSREGFFAGSAPIVDVGCGPSPHVGYRLSAHAENRDLSFLDTNPSALHVHRATYRHIQQEERASAHASWLLGDALDEPYLLSRKAVLVHGTLPTLTPASHTRVRYDAPEMARLSLESLLSAQPERLALYFDGGHEPGHPEHPARVLPALDHLGVKYRVFEGVASADFTPREGGYLVLLTP